MTDNVIRLVQSNEKPVKDGDGDPPGPTADDVLTAAMGKFDDVIVIGVREDAAQLVTSMTLDQAVYELARATHRVHVHIDRGG